MPFKGKRSRTFTVDEIDFIAKMYLAGSSAAQLASVFNVSRSPIRNALRMRRVASRLPGRRWHDVGTTSGIT